jgi:hypothetical protein
MLTEPPKYYIPAFFITKHKFKCDYLEFIDTKTIVTC